jgi:sugar/nucleoside kinase (ribokinase family)
MSTAAPRVTAIGPVNVDLFIRGSAPLDAAALARWVDVTDVQLIAAGSVGYTVAVMARLGLAVEVCTTVGRDAFGDFLRRSLVDAGIGTTFVAEADGETAIAIYILLFGDPKRPLAIRLPGFTAWPDPPPVLDGHLPRPDLLHCGGLLHFPDLYHRGLASTFAAARAAGIRTSIDPQFPLTTQEPPWLRFCDDALAEADVLLCDEDEARSLFGTHDLDAAITAAHRAGPGLVAVKQGERGSLVSDGQRLIRQPAVAVDPARVRESVGAGDAFDAGFLDALIRGADPVEATRRATATATLSLEGRGGAESITDRAAVETVLQRVPAAVIEGR